MNTQFTMSSWRRLAPALLICMHLGGTAQGADTPAAAARPPPEVTVNDLDRAFQRSSSLQIATPDARLHHFNSWIADDDQRRRARPHVHQTAAPR